MSKVIVNHKAAIEYGQGIPGQRIFKVRVRGSEQSTVDESDQLPFSTIVSVREQDWSAVIDLRFERDCERSIYMSDSIKATAVAACQKWGKTYPSVSGTNIEGAAL